jgi:hypothetical protein
VGHGMSKRDIVERLRNWRTVHLARLHLLMEEAADEMERLRLTDAIVRLPPLDPNGAPGWNAAIGAVRQALADAGVDWDTE